MPWLAWSLILVAASYATAIGWLVAAGRQTDARALAGFIPDCVVMFKRLASRPRVPRSQRLLVAATLLYLASPIDLLPDFLPVVGQLDDLIVVAVVLRSLLRTTEASLEDLWPGPDASLRLVERAVGGPRRSGDA